MNGLLGLIALSLVAAANVCERGNFEVLWRLSYVFYSACPLEGGCSPVWAQWSSWGECSTTCGQGQRERTRPCGGEGECLGRGSEEVCYDKNSLFILLSLGAVLSHRLHSNNVLVSLVTLYTNVRRWQTDAFTRQWTRARRAGKCLCYAKNIPCTNVS